MTTLKLHLKPTAKEKRTGFKSDCGKLKKPEEAEAVEAMIKGKIAAASTLNAEEDMNIDILP